MYRFFSSFVLFSAALVFSKLSADTVETATEQLDDREVKSIREFINTKRQVTLKEIGGNLSISAEVSTEFQDSNERLNGLRQRAPGGATDVAARGFDIGFGLIFDYRTDRTWMSAKLKFKNKAGLFGGTADKIKLDKAYWGVRLLEQEALTLDCEVGRRNLTTLFDSRAEFNANFDGVIFKYDQGFETLGNFYVHPAVFIIDQRKDHYGYVGEIGLLEIFNTGLYAKYSLIDWDTKHTNYSHLDQLKFDFLISQFLLGFRCVPKWLNQNLELYMAGLYNHEAKARSITAYQRAAWAAYAGFLIGMTRKQGDWAFETYYQAVAAQAIPDYDVGGVGIGNAANTSFYSNNNIPTTRKTAAGNTNFQGYLINFNYMLTDNLVVKQSWKQSITLNSRIGPLRRFKQYEVDFIYAF